MCIIYDNLRKRLGSVSKDRCIFVFLTVLSLLWQEFIVVIYQRCQDLNGLFITVNF